MRVRALAVAATAALIGLAVALPAPPAHADATRTLGIWLLARRDIGPLMSVQLLDASDTDVAPVCGQGVIPPDYFDWNCGLSDQTYTLVVTAPAGVSAEIHCRFDGGSDVVSSTGELSIPADSAYAGCWIYTTPDSSWPSSVTARLTLSAPATELATTHLALIDAGDAELTTGCTDDGVSWRRLCTAPPYGTYSIEPVGLPAGAKSTLNCSLTRSTKPNYDYFDTPAVTIDPTVTSLWCGAVAARPQVEIIGYEPWDGGLPTFSLRPVGAGDDIACSSIGSWKWSCLPPGPGTYQLVTDLVPATPYPRWLTCGATGGTAPSPGSAFPPTFAFATDDMDWYVCSFIATAPPPTTAPTTIVITDPITGGGSGVWPLALVLLGLGAAMMRLARRPLR